MNPPAITDTAIADRQRAIAEAQAAIRSDCRCNDCRYAWSITNPDTSAIIPCPRCGSLAISERLVRGECRCGYCQRQRARVTTERNSLRRELAQTVARNIELERRRVSLEAEVDRLDALWRHSERTLSEERLPAPAQESDSPFDADLPKT